MDPTGSVCGRWSLRGGVSVWGACVLELLISLKDQEKVARDLSFKRNLSFKRICFKSTDALLTSEGRMDWS